LTANIAALTRYPAKGEPGEALREVKLLEDLGMERDFHQGSERQLCLRTAEVRRWMDAQPQKGICFGRFRENILIEGLPDGTLPPGVRLCVGEAILQISAERKRCHDDCKLFSQGVRCRLSECAVFAIVERGGVIQVGDGVSL